MKAKRVVQIFDALSDLSEAAGPFLEFREMTRYEKARLASAYQQARQLVIGLGGEIRLLRGEWKEPGS